MNSMNDSSWEREKGSARDNTGSGESSTLGEFWKDPPRKRYPSLKDEQEFTRSREPYMGRPQAAESSVHLKNQKWPVEPELRT